jgi:hypothetical protein
LLAIVDVIISGVIISIRPPGRPPLKKENIDHKPARRQWQELSGFLLPVLQNFLSHFRSYICRFLFSGFLVLDIEKFALSSSCLVYEQNAPDFVINLLMHDWFFLFERGI